jgi:hypothetical protein
VNEWHELRTAALIVVWVTVAGGLVLALVWLRHGGARAVGPEDQIMSEAGNVVQSKNGKVTSFSSAHVGMHGLLALLTALLATYGLVRQDDRGGGYLAILGAVIITGIPGGLMFWKWHAGHRPAVRGVRVAAMDRAEDHLPRPVVYLHGLLAFAFVVLLVVLLAVD